MFLAIDTVFDQCAVALLDKVGKPIFADQVAGKYAQTENILPMIENAFEKSGYQPKDLTALFFNRGPGAFSGIRINTAVIQALSLAWDLPCVGVSSLQALAWQALDTMKDDPNFDPSTGFYSLIDARMDQVYLGKFVAKPQDSKDPQANLLLQAIAEETLLDYHQSTDQAYPIVSYTQDETDPLIALLPQQRLLNIPTPSAITIGELGRIQFAQSGGSSAENALPVYLRNHAWKTLKEQKIVKKKTHESPQSS